MKVLTEHDGWDCVPELKEVVDIINDDLGHHLYEIKNCVRTQSIEDLVIELRQGLQEALSILDTINTDVEYETKD
jgi:hypothetical protein